MPQTSLNTDSQCFQEGSGALVEPLDFGQFWVICFCCFFVWNLVHRDEHCLPSTYCGVRKQSRFLICVSPHFCLLLISHRRHIISLPLLVFLFLWPVHSVPDGSLWSLSIFQIWSKENWDTVKKNDDKRRLNESNYQTNPNGRGSAALSGNACVWAAQKAPFHNTKEKGRIFLGRSVEGGWLLRGQRENMMTLCKEELSD